MEGGTATGRYRVTRKRIGKKAEESSLERTQR